MDSLFSFGFFTTQTGFTAIGVVAALIVILWDWRGGLAGLLLVQWGVGNLLVQRFNMPSQWAMAFLFVVGLAGVMLAMSAMQVQWNRHVPRSGNVAMRLVVVLLAYFLFATQDVRLPLPLIDGQTIDLFSWLTLVSLLILLVGDSPLHMGISLALWLVTVQAATAILLPNPALFVIVGSVELALILACSYLVLPASRTTLGPRRMAPDQPQGTADMPIQTQVSNSPVNSSANPSVAPSAAPSPALPGGLTRG